MYYSKSTGGFYPKSMADEYAAAGSLPSDIVEITAEQRQALAAGEAAGKRIVAGPDGLPMLQDPQPLAHADLVEQTRVTARQIRTPIMSVLDGMQASALTDGDQPRAKAIESAKTGLRDITKLDLSGCSTDEDMRLVILSAYKAIAMAVPPSVLSAFSEVLS